MAASTASTATDWAANVVAYKTELEHFYDCVQNQARPICTAEDGLAAITPAEAIVQSGRTGQPVKINPSATTTAGGSRTDGKNHRFAAWAYTKSTALSRSKRLNFCPDGGSFTSIPVRLKIAIIASGRFVPSACQS